VHYRSENDIEVVLAPCSRCKKPVEEQVILEDYFWFVQVDDAG